MDLRRTPVVVVTGFDAVAVDAVASSAQTPGTVVVHHDLVELSLVVITRTIRTADADGVVHRRITRIDLDHGCVSCALREDLLPLLRALHRRDSVERIVLQLDPLIEPDRCAGRSTRWWSPTSRARSTDPQVATCGSRRSSDASTPRRG